MTGLDPDKCYRITETEHGFDAEETGALHDWDERIGYRQCRLCHSIESRSEPTPLNATAKLLAAIRKKR